MHFRERNQIVQIIRTKYDAALKKGKNEIVGRLVKANPKISDELAAALTKEERKEVANLDRGLRKGGTTQERTGGPHAAGTIDACKNGSRIKKAMTLAFWQLRCSGLATLRAALKKTTY